MVYEAFVLACLWGKPTENQYCTEFRDVRGPYDSRQECVDRAFEISDNMYKNEPEYQGRSYRCEQYRNLEEYEKKVIFVPDEYNKLKNR